VKINLQKVTFHDGGVANQLLAATKPSLPPACLGWRAGGSRMHKRLFTDYWRMSGEKFLYIFFNGKREDSLTYLLKECKNLFHQFTF
jgi:hypothetical protein